MLSDELSPYLLDVQRDAVGEGIDFLYFQCQHEAPNISIVANNRNLDERRFYGHFETLDQAKDYVASSILLALLTAINVSESDILA